jgi:hypothetical protein
MQVLFILTLSVLCAGWVAMGWLIYSANPLKMQRQNKICLLNVTEVCSRRKICNSSEVNTLGALSLCYAVVFICLTSTIDFEHNRKKHFTCCRNIKWNCKQTILLKRHTYMTLMLCFKLHLFGAVCCTGSLWSCFGSLTLLLNLLICFFFLHLIDYTKRDLLLQVNCGSCVRGKKERKRERKKELNCKRPATF